MGVLEVKKISQEANLNKEEFINTIIYNEILKYFGFDVSNMDYNKVDNNSYNVIFSKDIPSNVELNTIKTVITNYEIQNKQTEESAQALRNSLGINIKGSYESLSGIEGYIRRMYPKKITYNSSRTILKELARIVALDFLLGNSKNEIDRFFLYDENVNNYKLVNITSDALLFQNVPGISLTTNVNSRSTFDSTLNKYRDTIAKNNTAMQFDKSIQEYYSALLLDEYVNLISDALKEYDIKHTEIAIDKYIGGYQKQRRKLATKLYLK